MKKALIITYYWPPTGGAGVQRWLKFSKYMRDFGWEPVIYTAENPEMPERDESLLDEIPDQLTVLKTKIWEPYSVYKVFTGRPKSTKIAAGFLREKKKNPLLEKIAVWIRGNLFIPDARKFWIKPSVRYLCNYLKNNPVDIVISTGPPHTCHLIAEKIKEKTGIPWLADFRDPWTGIDFYKDLHLSNYADSIHHKLEKKVLKGADKIITVSPSMADDFNQLFPRSYDVLTNGYDHSDFVNNHEIRPGKEFSITHLGSMVPARNPALLWQCLAELIKNGHPIKDHLKIHLVGQVDHSIIQDLKVNNLSSYLTKTDYVSHGEAIAILKSSQLLLLVINRTANTKNILTGKIFEYMAAGRPIFCIGPVDGDAAKLITSSETGTCLDYDDKTGIPAEIERYFELYLHRKLNLPQASIKKYERRQLTSDLCEILNSIVKK